MRCERSILMEIKIIKILGQDKATTNIYRLPSSNANSLHQNRTVEYSSIRKQISFKMLIACLAVLLQAWRTSKRYSRQRSRTTKEGPKKIKGYHHLKQSILLIKFSIVWWSVIACKSKYESVRWMFDGGYLYYYAT